jgi:hypothetical protein
VAEVGPLNLRFIHGVMLGASRGHCNFCGTQTLGYFTALTWLGGRVLGADQNVASEGIPGSLRLWELGAGADVNRSDTGSSLPGVTWDLASMGAGANLCCQEGGGP